MVGARLQGTPLWKGRAQGLSTVLYEPLSWWGGIDPATSAVIDRNHPQLGVRTAGRIIILPGGRGSSGGSAVLAESIRLGTGPAGLILQAVDPILVVGVMVAAELYPDRRCPVVVVDQGYETLGDNLTTRIYRDGVVEQWPEEGPDSPREALFNR